MGPIEKAFVSPAAVGLKRIVHSKISILSSFTLPFKRKAVSYFHQGCNCLIKNSDSKTHFSAVIYISFPQDYLINRKFKRTVFI